MAVLTNSGKQWIVDKMRATNGGAVGVAKVQPNDTMKYVAWGTGTTAEANTQTALTTEAAETRVSGTLSSPSTNVHRTVGTLTSASGQTIAECGLFDHVTPAGSVMLIRAQFTGIALLSGDQIQFTFDYTQS